MKCSSLLFIIVALLAILLCVFASSCNNAAESPKVLSVAAPRLVTPLRRRGDPAAIRDEIAAALTRVGGDVEQRRLLSQLVCTYAAPGDATLFAACTSETPTLGTVRRVAAALATPAEAPPADDEALPWCLRPSAPATSCAGRRTKGKGQHSSLCHEHPSQPVTLDNITRAHQVQPDYHARLQIIGGRVYVLPLSPRETWFGLSAEALGPLRVYLRTLEKVAKKYALPDVDFVLNPLDATPPWPAFNQHAGHHRQFPVRDEVAGLSPFIIPSPEEPWRARRYDPPTEAQWAARKSVAAWRGSNTGFARTSLSSWSANPRARLTVLSRMYPDAIDAAITAWPQPHGGNLSVLKRFLRAAPRAKPGYFRRHKYVVDVDGNVQSNRFREVMSHDAIVLKATRFTSAYAPSLPSLPHVIRIRPDLSDLVPTLRCLQQHDAAALRALTRGMAAAATLLSYENVLAYWADLLAHYAPLQTFAPRLDPRAVPASRLYSWTEGSSSTWRLYVG